ncbi:MAG: hypothetical protein VW268_09535 [Rhodospirillaceae bacterium]
MRFALLGAAFAVALSFVANSAPAYAAGDCASNPNKAIKASEGNFKKMKKSMKPEAVKAYSKAIGDAKKAAKAKKKDAACAALAEAEGHLKK